MDYDTFENLKPSQWTLTREWIINRCLFLVYMTDLNNELFHGGDSDTVEGTLENYKKSFVPEYQEMIQRYPKLFNYAFGLWLNDMHAEKINYVRIENAKTGIR